MNAIGSPMQVPSIAPDTPCPMKERRRLGGAGAVGPFRRRVRTVELFLGAAAIGARHHHGVGDEAGIAADGALDRVGDLAIVLEEGLGVLAALADALAVIGEPGAGFLDHAGLDAEVDELAALR